MPTISSPHTAPTIQRYITTPTGYLMVLRMGDNVFHALETLMLAENIPSASLTAIGFGHATFGFWNAQEKAFDAKTFRDVEMGSIIGSLAWKGAQPAIHMHGVAGNRHFETYGGHLLDLDVSTGSMEVTIITHDLRLERLVDPCIGANILTL